MLLVCCCLLICCSDWLDVVKYTPPYCAEGAEPTFYSTKQQNLEKRARFAAEGKQILAAPKPPRPPAPKLGRVLGLAPVPVATSKSYS
jgi:hypothetical protein